MGLTDKPHITGTPADMDRADRVEEQQYALELHVLVMKIRELHGQVADLTRPAVAHYITQLEARQLHRLYNIIEHLEEGAVKLEEQWRARQGLSPKI